MKIEYGSITFLIDPWLQDPGTGFSAKAVRPEMQGVKCPMNALPGSPESILRGVDYCFVTHLHFDHFSVDYLPQDLRIIAQNHEDAEKIRKTGSVSFYKSGFVEVVKSEKWEVSRSKCDPSNCRI